MTRSSPARKTADLLYMLLIYFGLAHFLTTPFMKTFLWLFGCFVLIYTGVDTLRNVKITKEVSPREAQSSVSSFRYRIAPTGEKVLRSYLNGA